MKYNWQQPDWPNFKYDLSGLHDQLLRFAEKTGRVSGTLIGLSEEAQTEVMIDLLVQEATKTSAIEGEFINPEEIYSSIRNQLGLNKKIIKINDPRANRIANLVLDAQKTFKEPLTQQKLFQWHSMLFENIMPFRKMAIGQWRDHEEPMQVISGSLGNPIIHFEAPPSKIIPNEMKQFIQWFNLTMPNESNEIKPALVRSAIAHLYFESIHPFEDGNGRIGRAISEKAISQGLGYPQLMSLSQTIENNKKAYYAALKKAQSSNGCMLSK